MSLKRTPLVREANRTYREGEPCERIHILLYSDDIRWMQDNLVHMGLSAFVRTSVRKIIRSIEAGVERSAESVTSAASAANAPTGEQDEQQ